ncbi:MAG TPA: TonB-dependent receptor [Phenylobacterium sp.]|jgi:outer membrane receptor protein involved in Fe transport|nr:TonB-dependent receptor [Phenylobacterium sp.]
MRRLAGSIALLAIGGVAPAFAAAPAAKPSEAASSVAEVEVTAEAPPAQTQLDRKVYSLANDLQATSGSAADVLNEVPSVAVDADGNVSLRGDSNVTILVDGKPSAQFSGSSRGLSLQQFSAGDIARIEVLTTPPAQFKAEGSGGVINIITKKTRRAGLSGSGQLSAGENGRLVAALNGAYNDGPLKLSGGIGLRHDIKERLTATSRDVVDPTSSAVVASQQTIDERQRRWTPSIKAGVDYDINDNQSVGASFSHRELMGKRYFDQHDSDGLAGGAFADLSDRHDDGRDWNVDAGEGLRFDQKLWRPNETLSLNLQHSVDRERETNNYANSFTLPPSTQTFDELRLSHDLVKTEFSADYDLPLADERGVKLGYDLESDRNRFDPSGGAVDPVSGLIADNPAITNHFRYHQTINAAYGQYQAPLGPWQVQLGARFEASQATGLQVTDDIINRRSDSGLYPSLHLDRAVGDDGKISLGIARRLTRPDPEILNPFIDTQDTHNLRAGNPDLVPQDTWSYEAGYNVAAQALSYGATAYYRFDRNSLTDVVRPISDEVLLTTKANLPKSRSAGLEFTAAGKLGQQLAYSLSGDLFAAQIDATALGAPGLKSTTGLNLKASLDWRPTKVDTAQVSFSRADKRLTPQGSVDAINLVNLGYRRQLRPDLAAVVTVTDLFDGQRFQRLIATPQLRDVYLRNQYGRIAFVGLVYTFGGQGKAKPSAFDYQS